MEPALLPLIVIGLIVFSGIYTVRQQTVAIVERFGKFNGTAFPGLNFKIPFIDRVAARVNMRVQQLDVVVETKTLDDVFVDVKVSVQFQVMPDKVYEAYYKLTNIHDQVSAYVFDVVRARVPLLKLDDVFSKKEDIAMAVKHELHDTMDDFGYDILKALVTDIDPDDKVKHAMNEINAATRMRMAASEKGEADRILKVKAAEAEAQSKALEGQGIANQRKAIIEGLQQSVAEFQQSIHGATAQDVMMIVLLTQYFDTLKDIADRSQSNTIMLPNNPGGLSGFADQIREVMISANLISANPNDRIPANFAKQMDTIKQG
ncbi:MAG: SPFH domain-containing protein [Chitinophagales bacterium]|jgi:regulator of protease activity HflC (stomatin/prohibitin superfamily)|nr:SPFH domain-containing protein [Chitinophagales bacterium]